MHNALLFVCEEYDDQDSSQDDERRQHCYGGDHAGVDDPVASSAEGLPTLEKGAGGAVLEADGERVEHAVQAHVLPDSALRAHGRHAVAARSGSLHLTGRGARVRLRGRCWQRDSEGICNGGRRKLRLADGFALRQQSQHRGRLGLSSITLTFLRKDHPESGLALVTREASPERGPVDQCRPGVGDFGRLATRDGFALRSDARPGAALRAQPRRVSP